MRTEHVKRIFDVPSRDRIRKKWRRRNGGESGGRAREETSKADSNEDLDLPPTQRSQRWPPKAAVGDASECIASVVRITAENGSTAEMKRHDGAQNRAGRRAGERGNQIEEKTAGWWSVGTSDCEPDLRVGEDANWSILKSNRVPTSKKKAAVHW